MRGAPQRGLASAIRRMSARSSGATAGRPGPRCRLFQVQRSLKPVRCHRITVSGWTTATASAQPCHRRARKTQNSRSERRRRGRGAARWRTASWCRNARFSSTRARWVLSTRRRPLRMRVIMSAIIDQARRNSNVDEADGVNRRDRRGRVCLNRREGAAARPRAGATRNTPRRAGRRSLDASGRRSAGQPEDPRE